MSGTSLPNISVLLSGGGRTLENLLRVRDRGELPVHFAQVISSHADVRGLEIAREHGIPALTVDHREFRGDPEGYSRALTEAVESAAPDLVVLAGFLRHWSFPAALENRILNIHPSLLPAFGGRGFYGDRVHRAVLESGERFSGCTVHFASQIYDEGPIILQHVVPVAPQDTVDSLARRVFEQECRAYPEAIRMFIEGRLRVRDGQVEILDPASIPSTTPRTTPP